MVGTSILIILILLLASAHSLSNFSCTNSRVPLETKTPLEFCLYNGTVCCDHAEDLKLQKEFQKMEISDSKCASLVKSVICSICGQSSAQLQFSSGAASENIPPVCNSSASMDSSQSKENVSTDFWALAWETCESATISNSPFSSFKQLRGVILSNSSQSKHKGHWPSKRDFCDTFRASDKAARFRGKTVSHITFQASEMPEGVCLEKLGNETYLVMDPHPDGSNRVFLANHRGKIWLATIPEEGSKKHLQVDESKPFLDISDQVLIDDEFGMVGMVFHPNFLQNGRFFVSYYCDKLQHPGCFGRCACNTDVNCDPSKLTADGAVHPCQFYAVIAEYTTNGTSSSPRSAKRAYPYEVRRIFTFGLPSRGVHGGQILIGPEDGFLYFMVGDNARGYDRPSFAQDKKSILGKILRIDIDHIPSAEEIHNQELWGNYSIPRDNPYIDNKKFAPEVWALGLRQTWRCSFDSERPSYFLCGDAGQNQYEEIDIVTKGGNYGWPFYEGPYLFQLENTSQGAAPAKPVNSIFPVMGYNHSETKIGSASINGGFVYRSATDPCLFGRYLFMDLYAGVMWLGTENPRNSKNFTTSTAGFSCAHDSPMQCASAGHTVPSLGYILSFGQDNRKDLHIMTTSGVYRIARPSRCNYRWCSGEGIGTTKSYSSAPIRGLSWKAVQMYISFSAYLLLSL